MPDNTQAAIVQPVGDHAVAVIGSDTQRGFNRLQQAWLCCVADKLDASLGQGFGSAR